MIKAGIIGGAGYTAGELIRILMHHPKTAITFVQSNSHAGAMVSDVHADLAGDFNQVFCKEMPSEPDVLFLCTGHGRAKLFLQENNFSGKVKIIDLSSDFRLKTTAQGFVYGLPELNGSAIKKADKIANPGCFATAIQLALLPLAKNNLLQHEIHIHAITGSTGAGQQPKSTSHFSWRNNNVSVYKAFEHQHLNEIMESIKTLQSSFSHTINFIPVRGDFSRGIFTSVYLNCNLGQQEVAGCFKQYYKSAPFVKIVNSNPSLKQVVNTNKCILFLRKIDDKLHIISMIDNLLKGASGQAVQNMNLMFGLEEKLGLQLKAMVY